MIGNTSKLTVRIDVLDYDHSALKRYVLMILKNAGQQAIGLGVRLAGDIDNICWMIDKMDGINRAVCAEINKKITQSIDADGSLRMKAQRIRFRKKMPGMNVEIEFADVDLDVLLEKIIGIAEKKTEEKQIKKGLPGLKGTQTMMFNAMHKLNHGVGTKEKVKLLQMAWTLVDEHKMLRRLTDSLSKDPGTSIELLMVLRSLRLRSMTFWVE